MDRPASLSPQATSGFAALPLAAADGRQKHSIPTTSARDSAGRWWAPSGDRSDATYSPASEGHAVKVSGFAALPYSHLQIHGIGVGRLPDGPNPDGSAFLEDLWWSRDRS
jgi:hypothetical protein